MCSSGQFPGTQSHYCHYESLFVEADALSWTWNDQWGKIGTDIFSLTIFFFHHFLSPPSTPSYLQPSPTLPPSYPASPKPPITAVIPSTYFHFHPTLPYLIPFQDLLLPSISSHQLLPLPVAPPLVTSHYILLHHYLIQPSPISFRQLLPPSIAVTLHLLDSDLLPARFSFVLYK